MAKTLTTRVVKAISLLGSTQALNMLCSIVRGKMLASLVGPPGVALMGVLSQTIDFFANVTQLNIRTSAVRDLAVIPPDRRNETIGIVRRVSRTLGWLGLVLMFAFAPLLSQLFFHTTDYTWAFRISSAALLLQAMQGSEHIVLQAEGQYKQIASSGLITAVVGVLIAVPLFWIFRADGIAPSLVGYALISWLAAAWYTRGFKTGSSSSLSLRECFARSRPFIVTGFYLVVASLVSTAVSLAFLVVIQRHMGEVEEGLYNAGNTMLVRYVGVFFIAMSVEFYPRLSSAAVRPRYARLLMTHQAGVCSLMFFPCAIVAMLLTPWLIRLLYNSEFLPMAPYFIYGMVGMMIRPASTVLSYGFLATNKPRPYLLTEVVSSLVGFGFNVAGYLMWGWVGLGLSTAAWYLFDILIIYIVCRRSGTPCFPLRTLLMSLGMAAALLPLAYALC